MDTNINLSNTPINEIGRDEDPLNIELDDTSTEQHSQNSHEEDEDDYDDDSDDFNADEIELINDPIPLNDLNQYEIPVGEIIYSIKRLFKYECMYCMNIYDKFGLLSEHISDVHFPFNFIPKKVLRKQNVGELKCGKILMSESSHFVNICFLCQDIFDDGKKFSAHILENHVGTNGLLKIVYRGKRQQNTIYNNDFSLKIQEEKTPIAEGIDDDKRCKCQFCNKGFKRHSDRKRHERIHTGEKPYKCDICFKAFTQSGTLKGHKRTHAFQKFRQ